MAGAMVRSEMSQTQPLFDRVALLRHRKRALAQGPEYFLQEEALDEVKEKLTDIKRTFTDPAIVTGFGEFWQRAFPNAKVVEDSDTLSLDLAAHDLVIHAMSLHWSNDPVGQLIQCKRALRPDGVLIVALLGGQTLVELRAVLSEAEVALSGGLSPRVAPMAEIRDLGALLQRAGLNLPVADSTQRHVSYKDIFALMRELRAMAETNALTQRTKNPSPKHLFGRADRIYRDSFPAEGDRVMATYDLVFLTGWAPDDSQPQPLRPGSAKTRLADFLNTTELGEDAKPVKDEEMKKK